MAIFGVIPFIKLQNSNNTWMGTTVQTKQHLNNNYKILFQIIIIIFLNFFFFFF